ncbi:hypothetical protein SYNPS1DRAFT_21249 [Syncephalis pseudoplumigaleata]|uniref:Major facilitator superfamily domain-containing protein n=1 Tax=Syncephalis pseudoplumigaleata TaxID=1712513 RepID=A0A4P9Z417_9FUNG|nr:hypothetical protein SYNPS1DRAFT_21249 [Syncephalis pseudoplumigaleata]|eukprot:RKP27148.1 hypothetical protein SYNPS1DRAFT_21249 [Syncephalis pseudoplumigaleata]
MLFLFGLIAYAAHFGLALAERNGVYFGVLATGSIMTATIQMLLRWAVTIDKHRRIVLVAAGCTALGFWLNRVFHPVLFAIGYYGILAVSGLVLLLALIQLAVSFGDRTEARKYRQRHAVLLCIIAGLQIGANVSMVLFFTPAAYAAELLLCLIAVIV